MSETDKVPLQDIKVGGDRCETDGDCGGEGYGKCVRNTCKCEKDFVGPRCLVSYLSVCVRVYVRVWPSPISCSLMLS
jgi:uncharacterized ferredoxin-like protein